MHLNEGVKKQVKKPRNWILTALAGLGITGIPTGWWTDGVAYITYGIEIVEIYKEDPKAFRGMADFYSKHTDQIDELLEFYEGVPKLVNEAQQRDHDQQLLINLLLDKHRNGHAIGLRADETGRVTFRGVDGLSREAHLVRGSWAYFEDGEWHDVYP